MLSDMPYLPVLTLSPTLLRSFDTSMSQKSRFRMQMQGTYQYRYTFPQLPWGTLENPTYIQTAHVSACIQVLCCAGLIRFYRGML